MKKKLLLLSVLIMGSIAAAISQNRTITGKVISSDDKQPLPAVNVKISGTQTGVQTNLDGQYSIEVTPDAKVLSFSFVGYTTQDVEIKDQKTIDVVLALEKKVIDEVIVVGYGVATSRAKTAGAVATIGSKSIDQVPLGSMDNMLQGKASGVQITAINGQPGQAAFIRIRGVGSISAGNQPLFVVDGVPVDPVFYNALNPNDIDNVTVLKDAASTSIYGSRGSNGVILVTTKAGKRNKPQITYRYQYGVKSKTPDNFKMMDQKEKLQYEYELGYLNDPLAAIVAEKFPGKDYFNDLTDGQRQEARAGLTTNDWFKTLLRNAKLQSHEVSISGGNDDLKYFFALSDYDEEGINIGSTFNRKSGRLNVDYKANTWLRVGNSLTLSGISENLLRDRGNVQNPFVALYTYNTYEPEFLPDGTYDRTFSGFSVTEAIKNNPENSFRLAGVNSMFAEIKPLENQDLKIKTNLGLSLNDFKREYYIKPGSILDEYVGDPNAPGLKQDNGTRLFNYVWTNTLNWNKTIAEKNKFGFLAGSEFTNNAYSSYSLTSKGYPTAKVNTQNNGATPTAASSSKSDWALFSLFGKLTYNYDEKYFLEGTVRRDGSSRFGIDNRYGNFGSFGAGWNLAQESFLKNNKTIDLLKLRGSVGTSGNFNIPNYASLGLYALNASYHNQPASIPSQLPNPKLTWEKNFNYGIGVDFELFNSRLSGVIDYYYRKTYDLIFDMPVSQTTGFNSVSKNIGDMVNKGIELQLGYDFVRTKDWRWNVTANYTRNHNEITKLFGGNEIDGPAGIARLKEGFPIDNFYLVRWAGVDKNTGEAQWYNKSGEIVKTFNAGDAVILNGKSPDPKWFGNINTSVSYKNLTLSADLYYSGGNYIMNYMWQGINSDGDGAQTAQAEDALNYWKHPGDNATNPKPELSGGQTAWRNSTRYLQKGDYMRLRNVQLSYLLPANSFMQKAKLQSIRVFIQAQNIWTKTFGYKGDPEVGQGSGEDGASFIRQGLYSNFSYPQTRGITGGIDVTF